MLYYAYGTSLLTREEADDISATDKIRELLHQFATTRKAPRAIDLLYGSFSVEMSAPQLAVASANGVTPWEPIGVGKPITIDIREVYTGKYPSSTIWGRSNSPMLLTSAVKSVATYDAKPRAINFLSPKVEANSRLARPGATEHGTPVVFYSPAMVDRSITVDIGIVFDKFPQEAFDAIGNAFKSAAGIPVFLAQSFYLLAAGEIARIAGAVGEALFDQDPVFDTSSAIDLALPGSTPSEAGFMLIAPNDVDAIDPSFRTAYQISNGRLIDKGGKPYGGDIPYVILGLDGTQRDDLANFAPTAASAAVLSRFFGAKDGQSLSLEPLLDALKLYSDLSYREKLDRLDKRLASMKDGAEKDALKTQRDALLKNIGNDLLRPPS